MSRNVGARAREPLAALMSSQLSLTPHFLLFITLSLITLGLYEAAEIFSLRRKANINFGLNLVLDTAWSTLWSLYEVKP